MKKESQIHNKLESDEMAKQNNKHTFYIPVMGTGFTIDSPIKVAKYGISSVISLVDDILIENMREYYCRKENKKFKKIDKKEEDSRAKRFTEYLNLIDEIVTEKFEELKLSYNKNYKEIHKYLDMLPDAKSLKDEFNNLVDNNEYVQKIKSWLDKNLYLGSIDVNIMTKLDKANYKNGKQLPFEFNDAHASLRGFANSNLESSLILSAGMNPRLYSYLEKFDDFYPNENGYIKKKIVIKVSDYRSALIQGKFLAKKGLWVSEYRIESGLNCGGHAFATDGFLLGPILEEFKKNRTKLIETVYQTYLDALKRKNRPIPQVTLKQLITTQGGVGTAAEHKFLMDYYNIDLVGWGTPFLLVPEATNLDDKTIELLCNAKEDDLYLSKISPLGVRFNTVKGNTQEIEKLKLDANGNPGSSCPKRFLTFSKEYTDRPICTASKKFQNIKLKELEEANLDLENYNRKRQEIIEKECLCVGLGNSVNHIDGVSNKTNNNGISVCPGPNLAYFSERVSLKDMVDHIYDKINIIKRSDRPNLFIKELNLYYNYLIEKIDEVESPFTDKQITYFNKFINNMNEGINYYKEMFEEVKYKFEDVKEDFLVELENIQIKIRDIFNQERTIKVG